MNFREKLQQEQHPFDPEAWEAFLDLRRRGQSGAIAPQPGNRVTFSQRRVWLGLLILALALILGFYLLRGQTLSISAFPLPIPGSTKLSAVESATATPATTAPANGQQPPTVVDPAAPHHLIFPRLNGAAVEMASPVEGSMVGYAAPLDTTIASSPRALPSPEKSKRSLTARTDSDLKIKEDATGTSAPTAREITNSNLLSTPSLRLVYSTASRPPAIPAPEVDTRMRLRPRWAWQLATGWGRTNFSNPLQASVGFARSRIAGPYGEFAVRFTANRILSLSLGVSHYRGTDQTQHRDGQQETDRRTQVLLRTHFALVNKPRWQWDFTLGGGYEHSAFRFAAVEINTSGQGTRVLTPQREQISTFQLGSELSFRLNRYQSLGVFARYTTSNNGLYLNGLSYQLYF